jgi:hypothetical protein
MKVHLGRIPKDSSKERKVSVKIDKYDTWNVDHTLSLIIWPLLEQMQKDANGCGSVDDEDTPTALHRCNAEVKADNDWDTDSNWQKRWDYIIGEMIYAMREIATFKQGQDQFYDHSAVNENDDIQQQINAIKIDTEGYNLYEARVQNGCRLFGKYFQSLWT